MSRLPSKNQEEVIDLQSYIVQQENKDSSTPSKEESGREMLEQFLSWGFGLISIGYTIFSLVMFGATIDWFFGIYNFFLGICAYAFAFIFMMIPFGFLIVQAIISYYMAEVLDWGWIISLCITFPGIVIVLFIGAGSFVEGLRERFRR